MKRPVCLALFALFFLFPLVLVFDEASAQDATEEVEESLAREFARWKKQFAAPSYGVAFLPGRVNQQGVPFVNPLTGFNEGDFTNLAIDLRFFWGRHVARRGGFYAGAESGVFIFIPTNPSFTDSVEVDDSGADLGSIIPYTYDFTVEVDGAVVFIMMKYGYRRDFGSSLFGVSAGVEFGFGAGLYNGGVQLYIGDKDSDLGRVEYETTSNQFVPITELTAEFAIRMGRNFRIFAKGSVLYLAVDLPTVPTDPRNPIGDGNPTNSDNEYRSYALQSYEVELDGAAFSARVGVAVNFNL
jgi:hypothetical protein